LKKVYKKILVLPDIHFPFANWDALKQAKKWHDKHKPDLVIQLGDITDQKIWSRWQSDVDDYSPSKEFEMAERDMKKLHKMFPKMIILRGNHDERIKLRAIEAGIPGNMFSDVNEIFNYKGWEWIPRGEELIVKTLRGDIMFMHGDEMGGNVAQKTRRLGRSVIQGHTHKASITYSNSSLGHFFGAEMGCLMDVQSKAARYAQSNPVGLSIGFGVVKYGVPYFISYEEGVKV
jgi:predicted phosphodiesterase